MKVWIVTFDYYDEHSNYSVWDSKEKADKEKNRIDEAHKDHKIHYEWTWGSPISVEEFEVG